MPKAAAKDAEKADSPFPHAASLLNAVAVREHLVI